MTDCHSTSAPKIGQSVLPARFNSTSQPGPSPIPERFNSTTAPSIALIVNTLRTHRTGHRAAIWMRTRTAAS